MADTKMVSMKRTEADKREDRMETAPAEAMAPDYPWGLCIHLDKDELDKLGVKSLPAVGTEVTITAKAKVTRVQQSASQEGTREAEEYTSVDYQITDLAIG